MVLAGKLTAAIGIQFASVLDFACAAILVSEENDADEGGDSSMPRARWDVDSGEHHSGLAEFTFDRVERGEGLADALAEYKKYRNSDSIIAKLKKMEKNCSVDMKTEWLKDKDGDGKLFSVNVGNPKAEKTVMVAANEHAREILTGEVALRFVEMACDKTAADTLLEAAEASPKKVLENVNFVVLPIINKKGREIVETNKNICQRMTSEDEGDTDLNRNMEVDWGKGEKQSWGPKPFSAYQTRILRDLAKDIQPISFVDLHTGARSLMTSWGYKRDATTDFKDQSKALEVIQKKHCSDCKIGPNSIIIGYGNPGEIIDHMYSTQGIKYSTLWELFEGPGDTCLSQFNPKDKEYEKYVSNWATSLFTLGNYMDTKVNKSERSQPDVVKFNETNLLETSSGLLEEASAKAASAATASEPFPFT